MRPFSEGDTFSTLRGLIETTTNEIESLENEYVLKASEAELEEYYVEKALVDPIVLLSDEL